MPYDRLTNSVISNNEIRQLVNGYASVAAKLNHMISLWEVLFEMGNPDAVANIKKYVSDLELVKATEAHYLSLLGIA